MVAKDAVDVAVATAALATVAVVGLPVGIVHASLSTPVSRRIASFFVCLPYKTTQRHSCTQHTVVELQHNL